VDVDKKAGRDAFVRVLQTWADIGRHQAFYSGSSFLLSDLQTMNKARDAAYTRADTQARRIYAGAGSDENKKQRVTQTYMDTSMGLQKATNLKANAAGRNNNILDMMNAGARGNPSQVRQMVSNVGVMLDHENKPMVEPVRGTYTEGLNSAEFFQHMYGNRKGMIDKSQSVKDPGALTKQVIVSAAGYRVSEVDCGTMNGINEPTTGTTALDRYLAEPVAGVGTRTTIVTSSVLAAARAKGLKSLKVRSSLTCRSAVGVCARCYGLDEEGKLPPIGEHVGIKDTQGLTEPSTQLAMKSFHYGGVVTGKASLITGFDRVKQLFTMPETVYERGSLAEVGGRVDEIHSLPQGGAVVTIAHKPHRIARARKVTVKVGDHVDKGQQITDGDAHPDDILRLRGLRALQTQLRDNIAAVYAAGGEHIHPKTIEAPVRMLTEVVRISDAGEHPSYVIGDYSTYGKADAWNRENAGKKPVHYTHELPGAEYLPHRSDDWTKRIAHNRIQQVLQEAPAMGSKAPMQGESPFAPLIFGQRIAQDPWSPGGLTHG
jgi:DNA-directed RNA polymerase subunit beta'